MQCERFMAWMRFLRFIHLPLLFMLPLYYAWQASDVIQQTSNSHSEYHQWVCEHTELQIVHTVDAAQDTSPSPSITEPSSLAPESILKAAEAWNTFVDSRVAEWKIAATFAGLFVAASLTVFQIPEATKDPLTRAFASLAVCRSFAGLIYGPIFPLYFRSKFARSVHLAFLWSEDKAPTFCSPWTILSLPAATTVWGLLFFVFTVIRYTWSTAGGPRVNVPPTTSVEFAPVFRVVVATSVVLDLAGLFGIWMLLWRDTKVCLGKIRTNDGNCRTRLQVQHGTLSPA